MKQVVTINLGGNAYQLDEDGYEALAAYLDGARERLEGNPDLDEIMADLELAIADKAGRFLGPNKTVVSGTEVEQILREMGPVDMPPGPEDGTQQTGGGAAGDDDREVEREPRKLYRLTDPHEKMIAGICAGLAAYLGIDVSILRIIAIVLAFVSAGFALIGYVLLAVIIPPAETPEQRAAAWGVPFDAQDVLDRARSKFSEFRDYREARRQRRAERRYRERQSRGGADDLFRWLLSAVAIVFGIMVALSVVGNFFPNPMYLDFPGYYWRANWTGFLVLVVVLGFVLWLLGRPSRDGNRSFLGSVLLGTVQLIAIIGLIWFAYHAFSFVRYVVDGAVMAIHHVF